MNDEVNKDHWSFGKEKTTLVYGVHASLLIPIIACLFLKTSIMWIVVWLAIDLFAFFKGMTIVACLKRAKLQLGRIFHKGQRVRRKKFDLLKIKRGMYE